MGQARETSARLYELFAEDEIDGAAELFDSDCTHVMPSGEQSMDQWKAFTAAFRRALTDGHMDVAHVVESDDAVAVEGRLKGTFEQALEISQGDIEPTGKPIDLRFADFFRVSDGKIVEAWNNFDFMSMFQQLGALRLEADAAAPDQDDALPSLD